ncbi:MAG: 5-oxoprolinase subunit B family protein, partial [Nocardioidaceae bacterium]
ADLDVVADSWSCSVDDVVARHQAATFTVAFCGFAPGFAYCTSDPPLPPVRRRADPRTEVPAGSVALAGEYCGVYPRALPGGWQLIGVTDRTLFDPEQTEPALLRPGDTVRFEDRG